MDFKEALKTHHLYLIAAMLSLSTVGSSGIITFYKAFGQTFIFDDRFLAITGSIAGIFNSTGRLFWGYLIDRFSFKVYTPATLVLVIPPLSYMNLNLDVLFDNYDFSRGALIDPLFEQVHRHQRGLFGLDLRHFLPQLRHLHYCSDNRRQGVRAASLQCNLRLNIFNRGEDGETLAYSTLILNIRKQDPG